MLLGALLDAGLDDSHLLAEINKIGLSGLEISISQSRSQSIAAVAVDVYSSINQELRTLPDIISLLKSSSLDKDIIERSILVFSLLAEAEAKIHGTTVDKIHFHEVGAIDTIVDIVGSIIGLKFFQIDRLICSPLPMGRGFVDCAHGRLPLPAPAVCQLLKNVPTYGVEIAQELVTPTGAAIVKGLADAFGSQPTMSSEKIGYGAGSHELPNNQPNLLRIILGKSQAADNLQSVEIIETNLDDWAPEGFQHLCEKLLAAHALDVSATPIQMKKGRPGLQLQVICPIGLSSALSRILFSETTTIGVRVRTEKRYTLPRENITVTTPYGEMKVKRVITPDGPILYPEHDACVDAARKHQVSLKEVYRAIYRLNTP